MSRRQLSYQLDLDIERIQLLVNMPCEVNIWWKSSKNKISLKSPIKLTGTEKMFNVNERLSILAKIVVENGVVKEKKTQLLVVLFLKQGNNKLGGKIFINLGELIDVGNLTKEFVKKYEKKLENCPDQSSKIKYTLSCKYVQESTGRSLSPDNIHQVSFQATTGNFSSTMPDKFGRSQVDMTFRPELEEQSYRRQNSTYNLSGSTGNASMQLQQNTMPVRPEYVSKQKKRMQGQWEKEKGDTPSWDKSQRQRQQQASMGRKNQQVPLLINHGVNPNAQPNGRPLQFSFNPLTPNERQKMGLDNSEAMKQLKLIVEQRGQKIRMLQEQNAKLRAQSQDRSAKSITIMNQLNMATAQKQQLLRENNQYVNQIQKMREQMKKMEDRYKILQNDKSQMSNQFVGKLENRKKMIDELSSKLDEADRKIIKLQDELFKKQSELIAKQKQLQLFQGSKQSLTRQQNDKLKNISLALKQLQSNLDKVYAQKQQYRKKYQQTMYKHQRAEQTNQKLLQNMPKLQQQLQRQRQKSKMLENKYKQRQGTIAQIQDHLKLYSNQKSQIMRQKQQQLATLRDKFNLACKKLDEVQAREQSIRNTISEKNVRIQTLEAICAQNERVLEQKQQLINKAKEYVAAKEQQITNLNNEIVRRDEFIQKCRTYMQTKQKQYNQLLAAASKAPSPPPQPEPTHLHNQLAQKQQQLQQYILEQHRLHKQVQQMGEVVERYKARMFEYEDSVDQLQRKIDSQEQTLKELVKKNLDMEIQMNIKQYEIEALRGRG